MVRKQAMQDYVYWALNYPTPVPSQSNEYAYYYPFRHDTLPQGFQYSQSLLPLDHLQASRLVPATIRARVQLALSYHEARDGGKAMVWNHAETGELIDWYENIGLWGATTWSRQGKMGTILAKTREPLIERALRDPVIPRPNALKHIRQLPGMQEISPVLLPCGGGPLLEILERYDIQAASDREPLYPPSEWLVTLLYEERYMVTEHTSSTLPIVAQVLASLFERLSLFGQCGGATSWSNEDVPYTVCEREMHDLKALLGTAYPDFLLAFHKDEAVR